MKLNDTLDRDRLLQVLTKERKPFKIYREDNYVKPAIEICWNDNGDTFDFAEFFEDSGKHLCGGSGVHNPYYDGPEKEILREEYFDEVPELTKLEWKTLRWLLHHSGKYNQCGMTEKQIKRLQMILNLDEVEKEWIAKIENENTSKKKSTNLKHRNKK